MAGDPIISVRNLAARYGEDVILEGVSLEVYKGEILVILGSSGCGKSTLLRHMVGLDRVAAGKVMIDGVDITTCRSQEYHRILRKIGVLFQGGALFGSMTIGENVALPITEYSQLEKGPIEALVKMKLCAVGLDGYENHLPSEISGGMKKRAGLARSLALNPSILFLDEPTSGLDPVISAEIDDLIRHINQSLGTTMVIVTHDLGTIMRVADRSIMLDKTRKGIIAEGDPHELKRLSANPIVRNFFLRQARDPTAESESRP